MKRYLLLLIAVFAIPAFAQQTVTGNAAPSGPHYNLNIIGVTQGKKVPMMDSERHTIFVPLVTGQSGTDIYLTQGPFTVCDGNGFDVASDCSGRRVGAQGAVFQLPCNNNIAAATGTTLVSCTDRGSGSVAVYEVWARVVGKPGGSGRMTTCATELDTNTEVCSMNTEVFVRNKRNQFYNVTNDLTSLATSTQTISLFADGYQGYFWNYDNNGNKVLQLRFYLQ